jgi:hypothetical protein
MDRDRETSVHRGRRLRDLAERQLELFEALASGDAERVSQVRETLERLEFLHGVRSRKPAGDRG